MTKREKLIEAARKALASEFEPMSDHERIGGGYSDEYVRGWNAAMAAGVMVGPLLDAILAELREPDEGMIDAGKDKDYELRHPNRYDRKRTDPELDLQTVFSTMIDHVRKS